MTRTTTSTSAKTFAGCCCRSPRGNEPPSSCSTCTATDPRTLHGSWASVRRPSAHSRRRAEPCSEKEAPMAELKELFEMVTNKVEPDLDAWQKQDERRRQRQRRRRGAAFAVAAVVAALAIVAAIAVRNTSTRQPLTSPTAPPLSGTTTLVAFDVATGEATPLLKDVEA